MDYWAERKANEGKVIYNEVLHKRLFESKYAKQLQAVCTTFEWTEPLTCEQLYGLLGLLPQKEALELAPLFHRERPMTAQKMKEKELFARVCKDYPNSQVIVNVKTEEILQVVSDTGVDKDGNPTEKLMDFMGKKDLMSIHTRNLHV